MRHQFHPQTLTEPSDFSALLSTFLMKPLLETFSPCRRYSWTVGGPPSTGAPAPRAERTNLSTPTPRSRAPSVYGDAQMQRLTLQGSHWASINVTPGHRSTLVSFGKSCSSHQCFLPKFCHGQIINSNSVVSGCGSASQETQ